MAAPGLDLLKSNIKTRATVRRVWGMSGLSGKWDATCASTDAELFHAGERMLSILSHRGMRRAMSIDSSIGLMLATCAQEGPADDTIVKTENGRYTIALCGKFSQRGRHSGSFVDSGADASSVVSFANSVQANGIKRALQLTDEAICAAIWDAESATLTLARDRMGESPMYYAVCREGLIFASELKAVAHDRNGRRGINRDAIALLLRFGYIPAPYCIFEGVFKLPAGTTKEFRSHDILREGIRHDPCSGTDKFWDMLEVARENIGMRQCDDVLKSIQQIKRALYRAIDSHSSHNMPGVLLSGGVDSSLIAALMQERSHVPIETFSIGFENSRHDELKWAKLVAAFLGTNNHAIHISDRDACSVLKRLPEVFCEPYADSSQVPTLIGAKLVSKFKQVVLTGDGADELFFGHASYRRAIRNARIAGAIPPMIRKLASNLPVRLGERARLGGAYSILSEIPSWSVADSYLARISKWRNPEQIIMGGNEPETLFEDTSQHLQCGLPADEVLFLDIAMNFSDDLMTKMDRACMAASVEPRHPFVSPEMVALSWRIPFEHKDNGVEQKHVLKLLLEQYLPKHLVYRPKAGLGSPISSWLNGELRDWAESFLNRDSLRRQDFFVADKVDRMWKSFLDGQRKWHTHLWPVLMFLSWYDTLP